MQGCFIKATITPDMVGQPCILPSTAEVFADIKKLPFGELLGYKLYTKHDRVSLSYFNTYWACCQLVSDNYAGEDKLNYDSKEKVSEQIKIKCRFVDGYVFYHNEKTGEKTLNLMTKSISFDTPWEDVKAYFLEALPKMGEILGITADELVTEAKARMKSKRQICRGCGEAGIHRHHLFEQTQLNRSLYGDLLDDERNTVYLCDDCHEWKPVEHISEREFCYLMNIQPRSKTGKL